MTILFFYWDDFDCSTTTEKKEKNLHKSNRYSYWEKNIKLYIKVCLNDGREVIVDECAYHFTIG